ncbi:fatty acid transporter protein [Dichotomopilus funicola]|uniref:Very long-chain fatty acid transport protein n=1 Tax=Dichotomopilus funicola TaxID=1934379 RepID=A0AAN6UWV3_9PEZI|nr:fatty acid transporter protein [Dichotomopilus funicola]
MVSLPTAAAGALAGTAYLNARFSLAHDWLFFRIIGSTLLDLAWAKRVDRINLFYVLEKHARNDLLAGKPFVLFEGKEYTYAETYDTVLRYGTWLRKRLGVRERDIVALNYQNSETFVFLWFALWAIGAKPAFINYNLQGAALTHCLQKSTAMLVLVDSLLESSLTAELREGLSDVKFVVFDPDAKSEAEAQVPVRYTNEVRTEPDPANMALLIYTSGTTGMPKPAIVSWKKIYAGAALSTKGTSAGQKDIFYTCMPLYHSAGSCLSVCSALSVGATAAIGPRFSTKTFWKEVRETKSTIIQYVGETCRYLTVAPPDIDPATGENLDKKHCVRAAMGNGLRPDVWDQFKERFGIDTILEIYAATEAAAGLWNASRNAFGKAAIGRFGLLSSIILGFQTAIVLVDRESELPWRDLSTGFCQRAHADQPGEFIVRLQANDIKRGYQGYHGNQAATDSKVIRDVFKKGDAWFRSGDILQWDGEGRVYFNDRIGDTFRWKSENVSTTEVAQVLGLHPAVHEANVYGVQLPHHDGRAGCVAIVLGGNTAFDDHELEQVLASVAVHARQRLPKYAVPLFLRMVKEVGMETTATNKQQKHRLREQGVDPAEVQGDALFWLKNETSSYVPFTRADWGRLQGGSVKL